MSDDSPVADLVGPDLRLLFVGINPSILSAETGYHFAHPGNRFYPALRAAGILPDDVVTPAQAAPVLVDRGVGITNLVPRPSVRADELTDDELRVGRLRVERFVADHGPRIVAVAGITAYRTAFGDRKARLGRQDSTVGEAELWVVSNPSGLNAHATIATLAEAYREVAEAADITRVPRTHNRGVIVGMVTTATLVRPLTARSVVLSLLLGVHPPRLPVRDIVGAGERFGIAPATMRVALTRLVRAGDLVTEQAVYTLSPRHLERHRLQELELDPVRLPWDGSWETVVVTAGGRDAATRADLRRRLATRRLAMLREGVWMRPANLPSDRGGRARHPAAARAS